MMTRIGDPPRRGFYRSRQGIILGVCKGIARYFDFSVFWIRAIAVCMLLFSGIWPVMIVYFALALVMKPEPVIPITYDDEGEFYDTYLHSRKSAVSGLKRRYEEMDKRIRRIENAVTSKEFDWHRRFNRKYSSNR
jgi:phage shock protein C